MRNYKLKLIPDRNSIFNSKCFTEKQDEKLKQIGFKYDEFHKRYNKNYYYNPPYGVIEMIFLLGMEDCYIRFWSGRYILPCELKSYIGEQNYKKLMKIIKNDIKILKEIQVI